MGRPAQVSVTGAVGSRPVAARLLKDPFLHFLVLGGMLFVGYSVLGATRTKEAETPSELIHITAADADWLKEMWTRQWRRPPTNEELIGVVTDHINEEVLAREARELQLDVGDTVVRPRLAQRMAFLLEDTIRTSEPSEAELRTLYDARPDLATLPARVSFDHVFFSGCQKGTDAATQVAFAALAGAPDALPDGDRFLLGNAFAAQDEQSLVNLFGQAFARAVFAAERGRWSGPLQSDYGVHLVKVTDMRPARSRPLEEVRDRLAQEWHRQRQKTAKQELYAGVMRKYRIVADPAVSPLLPSLGNAQR